MRNLSIFVVIIFGIFCKSNCQILYFDKCPQVKPIESFELDRYMGTWYEHSKYPFVFEAGQKCQQAVYKNEGNGTVAVVNTGVIIGLNIPHSTIGTAKVIEPGQLAVSFKNKTVNTANYLILGTDYDNWAVVYSCKNIGPVNHSKLLWILTRQRQASNETLAAAKQIIKKNKLHSFMVVTSHNECPNIPNPFENDKQNPEASSASITTKSQSTTESLDTSTERLMDNA